MKQLIFTLLLSGISLYASAQVGIGTINPPSKMLTVRGSVLLDEGNNSNGSLDSTALLFGTAGNAGITSPKTSSNSVLNEGLMLYAGDTSRLTIHKNGNVRIGDTSTINTGVRFVVGGRSSFKGNVAVGGTGNFQSGAEFTVNGNAIVTDDASIYGYVGIGGFLANPLGNYKLLINGSTRTSADLKVNGDVDVDGSIIADGDITSGDDLISTDDAIIGGSAFITGSSSVSGNSVVSGNSTTYGNSATSGNATVGGGLTVTGEILVDANNGIVKSNTTDQLRMAFNSGAFTFSLNSGSYVDITFAIANFTGNNNDVRVAINQFIPASGSGNTWQQITMTVFDTDASTNTCQVRFYNAGSALASMNGTLYLTTIFTD